MAHIILNRSKKGGVSETLGTITVPSKLFGCCTLEKPDNGNQKKISCYPEGLYNWVKVAATAKIPYTHISILNVPNRSGICVHAANFVSQLEGCTSVGNGFVDINSDGLLDVTNSQSTFKKLMDLLPDSGTIEII